MSRRLVTAESPELSGRIPYKMSFGSEGQLLFRWIFVGHKKFTEPFFSDTVLTCLSFPENSDMPYTTAETLIQKARTVNAVPPTAFVYHVSRCGSTLLAQMLSLDEHNIVLSEAGVLDDVLRLPFSHSDKKFPPVDELFCSILRLMGEKRSGKEKYLFIKTDSWHLMFYEQIRKLFPGIPSFLLYRSPAEIIRSQEKNKGMHAVKGLIETEIFGFSPEEMNGILPAPYFEKVLERYFRKCLQILNTDTLSHVMSYHDGPVKMFQLVTSICNMEITPEIMHRAHARTAHHSKNPGEKFQAGLPAEIPAAAQLGKLFSQLNTENGKRISAAQ